MVHKVTRLATAPKIDARWDKAPWNGIQPELLANYMGEKPEHMPKTQVKIDLDFIGFTIPNEFVVGYGLDFAELYRNLPYIGVIRS